jgi:hypothetical protein
MYNNKIMTPDDIKITIFINTIFNKMNIKSKEQYDIFDVCDTLHKNSQKIDSINDMLISEIVKNLFKTIETENIWKVFIILSVLAELSSDNIGIYYQYNIYDECKKQNIYNWNDTKIALQNSINKLEANSCIEKTSELFIGYLFVGIESMAYYGNKNFSLIQSELAIYEWITGFGNFVEYNNSISILFDTINSFALRDAIMDNFINILSVFYKVDFKDCKNIDETYNWEKVSEIVSSGLL